MVGVFSFYRYVLDGRFPSFGFRFCLSWKSLAESLGVNGFSFGPWGGFVGVSCLRLWGRVVFFQMVSADFSGSNQALMGFRHLVFRFLPAGDFL